jgi:hypothetical protein
MNQLLENQQKQFNSQQQQRMQMQETMLAVLEKVTK